jgi:hypothetical protein
MSKLKTNLEENIKQRSSRVRLSTIASRNNRNSTIYNVDGDNVECCQLQEPRSRAANTTFHCPSSVSVLMYDNSYFSKCFSLENISK